MADTRERVEPTAGDKRYVRRDREGKFGESDDVGRSPTADRRAGPGPSPEGSRATGAWTARKPLG